MLCLPRSLALPVLALAAALTHGIAAAELPTPVAQALARAKIPASALGIVVEEAGASPRAKSLLRHRAEAPMNPASVMKLVTTTAALELLGPNWKWRTPVYVDGVIREGTLQGDLYIEGRGDPKLVAERLWLLLRRVQGLGISRINGDIVLDDGLFEAVPHDPGEFDGEPLRPYNAAPNALLLNFKSVLMTFTPDRATGVARLHVEPPLAGVAWPATVPLSQERCGDWRGGLQANFAQTGFGRAEGSTPVQPRFGGRYPAACEEKIWPLAWPDPEGYNARAIAGMWQAIGGTLRGQVRAGRVPEALRDSSRGPVFALESPPLAEVVRDINKYSNNVMTQQLFLTLSLEQAAAPPESGTASAPPPQGTLAASRALLQDWWRERLAVKGQMDEGAPRISNGSGLSREDRVSPAALARLLQYAWDGPLMPELLTSLPISGQDGTLRPERWRARGSAHLKTGSLRDVNSLAGVVDAQSGRRYVLVAIVNHPNAAAARPALEALVDWVARQ
ncbi:D-alanyl-D-alanine carboxypeptidase/D-alanyl-D-alanine endopeptidase [Hylemonella gracilis]|uniref:D-alanyl-D-alanine carboxypeptidase/D-alanyl-D-alanine-endopeptidase n=1 Tax=Hylemonella gracilis ATCC 19624 TaxID=887062 RepID=F3KXW0_9BURK|nr:D-alanyl-D-alanine carboxypeptidase/D-alanyl-D-alanine-endopeptidase [Hylemonella gracilis]EGI75385.1 D-alanyl-D-alanine carboxypeptidase/D-alanyl-D-alanine-endopeptidase [Hylemonella gracilis ATCC 19624]